MPLLPLSTIRTNIQSALFYIFWAVREIINLKQSPISCSCLSQKLDFSFLLFLVLASFLSSEKFPASKLPSNKHTCHVVSFIKTKVVKSELIQDVFLGSGEGLETYGCFLSFPFGFSIAFTIGLFFNVLILVILMRNGFRNLVTLVF